MKSERRSTDVHFFSCLEKQRFFVGGLPTYFLYLMFDERREEAEGQETSVSSIPQERDFLQGHTSKFPDSRNLNPFLTGQ